MIYRRGEITKKGEAKKIAAFDRISVIQEEMIRLAEEAGWLQIEQRWSHHSHDLHAPPKEISPPPGDVGSNLILWNWWLRIYQMGRPSRSVVVLNGAGSR